MKYQPVAGVWEVTMGCNMRCGHCGSSCKNPLPDELTTEEAFRLIDMLIDLKLNWITLSGGEPLTRKDLPLLIDRLTKGKVKANVITNGWNITENLAKDLKQAGVSTVAISIDGDKETHDKIRREGAFERAQKSFEILKSQDIYTASITTVSKQNIHLLEKIKKELISMGVDMWQLQLGLPMGNFSKHKDWMLEPCQRKDIIDFCYNTYMEGKIEVYPADCIGYYNDKLSFVNNTRFGGWDGCNAGIRSFGILHNGDIVGCTSVRDKSFIEGNIKERNLRDIWEDPNSFAWRRNFKKSNLTGDCAKCRYGDECLGGCSNSRLTTKGSIYSENLYCSFNNLMKEFRKKLKQFDDKDMLFNKAYECVESGSYQEAQLLMEKIIELNK